MQNPIPGIHHITAIASDPLENVNFYTGFLGLRLVKKTVNFDDPTAYHLYYGDRLGTPGTILTFFTWPGARPGRLGSGEPVAISFTVPNGSLSWWQEHGRSAGASMDAPAERFNHQVLTFKDPDGIRLELVEGPRSPCSQPWEGSTIPEEHAIQAFRGVTLSEKGYEKTAALLTGDLGFRRLAEHKNRHRFAAGEGDAQAMVDILCEPERPRGSMGAGSIHHVAWRTPGDEAQKQWRDDLASHGYDVTPVIDRQYFQSIYFREPGGVLFEIATDPPGFSIDESVEQLGSALRLPPWLEPQRAHIEASLPPIRGAAK